MSYALQRSQNTSKLKVAVRKACSNTRSAKLRTPNENLTAAALACTSLHPLSSFFARVEGRQSAAFLPSRADTRQKLRLSTGPLTSSAQVGMLAGIIPDLISTEAGEGSRIASLSALSTAARMDLCWTQFRIAGHQPGSSPARRCRLPRNNIQASIFFGLVGSFSVV